MTLSTASAWALLKRNRLQGPFLCPVSGFLLFLAMGVRYLRYDACHVSITREMHPPFATRAVNRR